MAPLAPALALAALLLAAGASAQNATTTAAPTTTAGPAPTSVPEVNGLLEWPVNKTLLYNQTDDCAAWFVRVPRGEQLSATVCISAGYAFAWVYDRDETTRGTDIPSNVTSESLTCLPPNANKPPLNRDIRGRVYIPDDPGPTTRQRCFTEQIPKGSVCLSYDAVFYMYTSLKWTNDTTENAAGRPIPLTDEYFKVPQVLNITGSTNIDCGSWSVVTTRTTSAATATGTATGSATPVSTTSRPSGAGALHAWAAFVQAAVLAVLAAMAF